MLHPSAALDEVNAFANLLRLMRPASSKQQTGPAAMEEVRSAYDGRVVSAHDLDVY